MNQKEWLNIEFVVGCQPLTRSDYQYKMRWSENNYVQSKCDFFRKMCFLELKLFSCQATRMDNFTLVAHHIMIYKVVFASFGRMSFLYICLFHVQSILI